MVDFGMQPHEAIGAARYHYQWSPDRLRVESSMSESLESELRSFGHDLTVADSNNVGVSQFIVRDPETGVFTGVHDPRVPGSSLGTD